MKFTKRYSFWKIFWVVVGLYTIFGLIGILAVSLIPKEANKLSSIFTWRIAVKTVLSILFATVFYYASINYYYHLITVKKKLLHFVRFSVILVLFSSGYHIASHFLFPESTGANEANAALVVFGVSINTIFFIGVSLLIAYLTNLRDQQKQHKVLEAQKLQLEIEKSQANFNFLKAQINPHFLHNTLNFLYAKSLPYSSELSEGILTLADIMRYALSEGNAKDGKAPLKDEIEHVRNVIKINQLRFSNTLNVEFTVNGNVDGISIIPFVLITIVENAFKHGDLKNQNAPIEIKIDVKNNRLNFWCRNKKKAGPKELSTGVGLDNIRKRLDIAYGDHYHFNIEDDQ